MHPIPLQRGQSREMANRHVFEISTVVVTGTPYNGISPKLENREAADP